MTTMIARPNKTAGRTVLGPKRVQRGYARIVSNADGSGTIELYDPDARIWVNALDHCSFNELWSGAPILKIDAERIQAGTDFGIDSKR